MSRYPVPCLGGHRGLGWKDGLDHVGVGGAPTSLISAEWPGCPTRGGKGVAVHI